MRAAGLQNRRLILLIPMIGVMLLAQLFLHVHAISHLDDHDEGNHDTEYCYLCISSTPLDSTLASSVPEALIAGCVLFTTTLYFHLFSLSPQSSNRVRAPPVL